MRIVIGNILSAADLKLVRVALAQATFVDGRATAGFSARVVKNNLQADSQSLTPLRTLLADRILAHEVFRSAVRPKALSPLLISRYDKGMRYGTHMDDAVMQGMRADVAFTLFLASPKDYEGGELVLEGASGEDTFKLAAGTMVTYPATTLHRVEPVKRGARLAVAGWARSFVRDPAQRELLFDLDSARRTMFDRNGKTNEFDLISKSFANLMRMWVDD